MITRSACSLVGVEQVVHIRPGSLAERLFGVSSAVESFMCNYGVARDYLDALAQGGLGLSGFSPDGELRIIELTKHPFFVATLFLPQMRSTAEQPHPLFVAFARSVKDHRG